MPEVMQPWAARGRRTTQANLSRQGPEHPIDGAVPQRGSELVHEEVRGRPTRALPQKAVATFRESGQHLDGGGMERNQPRLAKLRSPDREQALGPIDIRALQAERFTQAQAG